MEAESVLWRYLRDLCQDPGSRSMDNISQDITSLSSISMECRRKFIDISDISNTNDIIVNFSSDLIQSDRSINLEMLNLLYESVQTSIPHLLAVIFVHEGFKRIMFSTDLTIEDHIALSLINCSIIENCMLQLSRLKGYAVILFKDALSALEHDLPRSFVHLCQYLFLPSGLNIRNLIWHGFMSSAEFDEKYSKLFLSLRVTCEAILNSIQLTLSFPKITSSCSTYSEFQRFNQQFRQFPLSHLQSYQSLFHLPTQIPLIISAFNDFRSGQHLYCLLKMLPVLEHSLRFLFCLSNNLPEYILAQEGAYYSTLDGFGQRSKHQLLLDPFLHSKHQITENTTIERRNQLPIILGTGAYSVLVDLFFSDAGTNLRSQFAHDEINLAELETCQTEGKDSASQESLRRYLEEMALVVLVVYTGLCGKFELTEIDCSQLVQNSYSNIFSLRKKRKSCDKDNQIFEDCCAFLDSCTSWFHPHAILSRSIHEAYNNLLAIDKFLSRRHQVTFTDSREDTIQLGEREIKINISVSDGVSGELQVWEREKRIKSILTPLDISYLLNSDAEFPALNTFRDCLAVQLKEATVGSLVENINFLCQTSLTSILEHIQRTGQEETIISLTTLLHSIITCPISIFDHHSTSCKRFNSIWAHFSTLLSTFLTSKLDLYSYLLPGIACCGQICQVISTILTEIIRILHEKELQISHATAHTTERRQYLVYLLDLAPLMIHLSTYSLSILLLYISSQISPKQTNLHVSTKLMMYLFSTLSSFATCVGITQTSLSPQQSKLEEKSSKKSLEKSLLQLETALKSKQMKISPPRRI